MSERKSPRVVKVPKPEAGAYNHDRPITALIINQIRHLKHVEEMLPEDRRTGIDIAKIETELEASEYIQKVTAELLRS